MPGPLLPVLGPIAPALIIVLTLRRWPLASGITASAGAFLLGLLTAAIPLQGDGPAAGPAATDALIAGDEMIILGRSLLLGEGAGQVLVAVFLGAALLFLLSARWPQGPDFVPAGLLALSPLAFAVMVRPFTFGAVALLVAAAPLAAMIQGRRGGSTLASVRFVQLTALTIPAFLISGWMLDSEQSVLAGAIWRLLPLALVILLGGFPFHLWVRPLIKEAEPLVIVFVLGLVQLLLATFIWRLLQEYAGVLQTARFTTPLAWSGAATALLASLLALGADGPRRLLASLALADIGATLLVFSVGETGSAQLWLLLLSRSFSLLVAAAGLSLLESGAANLSPRSGGALWHRPYGVILFAYGAASLIGLPLTPGFAARWAAAGLLAGDSLLLALPILLALAGGTVGLLRFVARASEKTEQAPESWPRSGGLPEKAVLAVGLPAVILLALFSWPLVTFAERLAAYF